MRLLQSPNADMKALSVVVPIIKGGTGADNSTEAVQNLGGLNAAYLGQPNGVAKLNEQGKLDLTAFPNMVTVGPTLNGPTVVFTGQTVEYTITNYDINTTYEISASVGTLTRSGDTLTYTAPGTPGSLTLTVNNNVATVAIQNTIPIAPSITSPVTGSTNLSASVAVTATSFAMNNGTDTHAASDWQVATDSAFTNIISSTINDTINKNSWTATGLSPNTTYYVRVRYKGAVYGYGSWSIANTFSTKVSFIPNNESAILIPNDAGDNNAIPGTGVVVSINAAGDLVAIGSRWSGPSGLSNAGKVYIFSRSGTAWTQQAVLTASDKASGDNFGMQVCLDSIGNRLVVLSAKGFYNFTYSNNIWTQESVYYITVKTNISIGFDLSGDGTKIAIGNNTSSTVGEIQVFKRTGISWSQESVGSLNNATAFDHIGVDISIDYSGNRIIASTIYDGQVQSESNGRAYIYKFTSGVWYMEAILSATDGVEYNNYFGSRCLINAAGDLVAIGSFRSSSSGLSNAGKVYIFSRSGTAWTQQAVLTASDKASGDNFGIRISLSKSSNVLIIHGYSGSYIFTSSNNTWTQQAKILYSTSSTISSDGKFLALYGLSQEVKIFN